MIAPFKGYRYSEKAGNLENLIAPPYDVITKDYRKELLNRSPYNIVNLTLPESFDSEYHNKVAETLETWCEKGIFCQDEKEFFYLVSQKFNFEGKSYVRHGFICLLDLSKYEKIIKHEVIFNRYMDDRIKLLKATRSNLEPIFLIYQDNEKIVEKVAREVEPERKIFFEDTEISFSRCNPESLQRLMVSIEKNGLFIADGHHRFQASLEFFKQNPDKRYIMVYMINLFSDSLLVLPTHRAVKNVSIKERAEKLRNFFTFKATKNLEETILLLDNSTDTTFGVYSDGHFQLLQVSDIEEIKRNMPENHSEQWKTLDVTILHHFLFEKIFKRSANEKLFYDRSPEVIVDYVDQNSPAAGFFMKKQDLEKIIMVSRKGEILPPKTTFFYPKIPSGLVISRYV